MPTTIEQHKASLHQPAFSELLPVRDILSDVIIRTTGALVAATNSVASTRTTTTTMAGTGRNWRSKR